MVISLDNDMGQMKVTGNNVCNCRKHNCQIKYSFVLNMDVLLNRLVLSNRAYKMYVCRHAYIYVRVCMHVYVFMHLCKCEVHEFMHVQLHELTKQVRHEQWFMQ